MVWSSGPGIDPWEAPASPGCLRCPGLRLERVVWPAWAGAAGLLTHGPPLAPRLRPGTVPGNLSRRSLGEGSSPEFFAFLLRSAFLGQTSVPQIFVESLEDFQVGLNLLAAKYTPCAEIYSTFPLSPYINYLTNIY